MIIQVNTDRNIEGSRELAQQIKTVVGNSWTSLVSRDDESGKCLSSDKERP